MSRIAVLGGGVMGEAIIAGVRRTDPTLDLVIAEKRADRAAELAERYDVACAEPVAAVRGADVVILVVKPQDTPHLLSEVGPHVAAGTLVISIAAGIRTESITRHMTGAQVVRAMPNTPARIGHGVTGVSPSADCPPAALQQAVALLGALGTVMEIPEDLQDAFTAVAGSGPAYVFYLAESMIAAGVELGMSPQVARQAVVQTLVGSAELLAASSDDPADLRARVTSPGGTTAAAVRVLDSAGTADVLIAAITAARDRGRELAG